MIFKIENDIYNFFIIKDGYFKSLYVFKTVKIKLEITQIEHDEYFDNFCFTNNILPNFKLLKDNVKIKLNYDEINRIIQYLKNNKYAGFSWRTIKKVNNESEDILNKLYSNQT
jgi:hypothetical protein